MEILKTPDVLSDKAKKSAPVLQLENAKVLNIQLRKGESIPEHHANAEVVIVVRRGRVEFTVEGETVVASPENVLHLAPLENHQLTAQEDSDLLVFQINA
ncbi:cupin domain-containing protein [Planococcus sp. ISL-109]|uniref:cupin domain-containing protein n=1 Tax=Planococcus sp. ISL-109 TaxID=2819166 RepID=UPI001BEC5D4A|nr:cupin domain-containing protein [Planococcus sp. ISL-109]MBT2582741.1 cupin domain-containing protein [Planococcus sp. ISL-109]